MTRDTRIQLTACLVLGLCLTASGVMAPRLTASMGRNRLVYTDTAEADTPPEVVLGIAMGAFRGLFVNYLWIRANDLKEAGRYYEAVQLADAITKLQPRFPRVWVFHAWNMAYNISVTTQTRQERWQWVQAGIRLLRDRGIPANPNDMLIHKELAWIFQHKVGGYTDDANAFYKRKLAEEWTIVLGPPPPPDPKDRDRAHAIAKFAGWLREISEAPDTLGELEKQEPLTAELARRLKDEVGENLDMLMLRRYEMHRAAATSVRRAVIEAAQGPRHRAMAALMADARYVAAWPRLLAYTRKRALVGEFHMEPDRMIRYTQKYGPMDWRHAGAHAVYWSARGVENALGRYTSANVKDFDFINADRGTIQAVQELARSGEVYFNFLDFVMGGNALYLALPNTHFVQTYGDILAELVARSWADRWSGKDARPYSFYSAGYENFLRDQIRFYYRRGQRNIAEDLQKRLREFPGQNMNDEERIENTRLPLDEFVDKEMKDQFKSPYVAVAEIVAALQGAYTSGLLAGDDELFRTQFKYAKDFHAYFLKAQGRLNPVDIEQARMVAMPAEFRQMAAQVYWALLQILDLDDAERVYDHSPEDLRQAAYDLLKDRFKTVLDDDAKAGGREFEKVFPEPAGMDQFRAVMARWEKEEEAKRPPPVVAPK